MPGVLGGISKHVYAVALLGFVVFYATVDTATADRQAQAFCSASVGGSVGKLPAAPKASTTLSPSSSSTSGVAGSPLT